jgi:hypothetical protein
MIAYISLGNADNPTLCQLQDRYLRRRSYAAAFSIEGRGFRVVVEIETLIVRAGSARRLTEQMEWAQENVGLLHAEWRRLNRRG